MFQVDGEPQEAADRLPPALDTHAGRRPARSPGSRRGVHERCHSPAAWKHLVSGRYTFTLVARGRGGKKQRQKLFVGRSFRPRLHSRLRAPRTAPSVLRTPISGPSTSAVSRAEQAFVKTAPSSTRPGTRPRPPSPRRSTPKLSLAGRQATPLLAGRGVRPLGPGPCARVQGQRSVPADDGRRVRRRLRGRGDARELSARRQRSRSALRACSQRAARRTGSCSRARTSPRSASARAPTTGPPTWAVREGPLRTPARGS